MRRVKNNKILLKQGDIVLVEFGKCFDGCRTKGTKPSIVVSSNKTLREENVINVIPLYRSPSKAFNTEGVMVKAKDCKGLRYDEYAQPFQMQAVPKYRIKKRIGNITNENSLYEIVEAIYRMIKTNMWEGE